MEVVAKAWWTKQHKKVEIRAKPKPEFCELNANSPKSQNGRGRARQGRARGEGRARAGQRAGQGRARAPKPESCELDANSPKSQNPEQDQPDRR